MGLCLKTGKLNTTVSKQWCSARQGGSTFVQAPTVTYVPLNDGTSPSLILYVFIAS